MLLFCNIDAYTGFEFDRKGVGENGDLFDEPSNNLLVEVCDLGCLMADEILQFLDPLHGFFATVSVDGSFFFLLPYPEDLVLDKNISLIKTEKR